MRCDDARLDLVAYLREEIATDERAALDDHLDSCAACRREREVLAQTLELVGRALPAVTVPSGMKEGALAVVERDRVGRLLTAGDLYVPPPGMKARTLERVHGSSARDRGRFLVAALASAAVIAVLFALAYRGELGRVAAERDRAAAIAARAEDQAGPAGHPVQTLTLAGRGVASTVDLYHFRHDNYRFVLTLEEIPLTPPGHHYELWLSGPSGHVPVGSFRIKSPGPLTNAWVVGVDPGEFPRLLVTVEPNDGDPSISRRVLAEGAIDPEHVHHGRYDE